MKFILCCIYLFLFVKSISAISLSDFVPSFIYDHKESQSFEIKPFVNIKRNSSSENIWYCNRSLKNITNVFCNKSIQHNGVIDNSSNSDKSQVVDNSATNNNSNNNQLLNNVPTTLQDQNVRDALKNQNTIYLPLSPEDNLKMDINQQRVQFNYKY
jgi:hypothetical protein